MTYKLTWTHKATGNTHSGPILAVVKDRTLVTLTKEQANKRLKYFNKNYKNAKHQLKEVPGINRLDLTELVKVHPFFTEVLDTSTMELFNYEDLILSFSLPDLDEEPESVSL